MRLRSGLKIEICERTFLLIQKSCVKGIYFETRTQKWSQFEKFFWGPFEQFSKWLRLPGWGAIGSVIPLLYPLKSKKALNAYLNSV